MVSSTFEDLQGICLYFIPLVFQLIPSAFWNFHILLISTTTTSFYKISSPKVIAARVSQRKVAHEFNFVTKFYIKSDQRCYFTLNKCMY